MDGHSSSSIALSRNLRVVAFLQPKLSTETVAGRPSIVSTAACPLKAALCRSITSQIQNRVSKQTSKNCHSINTNQHPWTPPHLQNKVAGSNVKQHYSTAPLSEQSCQKHFLSYIYCTRKPPDTVYLVEALMFKSKSHWIPERGQKCQNSSEDQLAKFTRNTDCGLLLAAL